MSDSIPVTLAPRDEDSSVSWRTNLFAILLTGECLSVPCYIFVLYHLLRDKNARQSLPNHSIIALLMFNFLQLLIDLSMTLDFYRVGYRSPFNIPLCFIHVYVDYAFWYAGLHLMFWISIERHILIFYSRLVATARGRYLVHYLPLGLVVLYAPILYFYLIVLCPCQRVYNPFSLFCGVVCFRGIVPDWFNWFESIVNYVLPIVAFGVFSCALIVRVIVQKRRLQQAVDWRRHRKLIIQLILVSAVYLAFDLPYVIATISAWFGVGLFDDYTVSQYLGGLTYFPAIFLPYASMVALPGLKQKLRSLIFCKEQQQRVVVGSTRAH